MKKLIGLFFGLVLVFSLAGTASAQVGLPDYLRPDNLPNASRGTVGEDASDYAAQGVQGIIGDIISIILLVAGALTVFQIVSNAWNMVISAGKGETIDARKKALFWNIVGLVLILLSYIIIRFTIEFVTTAFNEPTAPQAQTVPQGGTAAPAAPAAPEQRSAPSTFRLPPQP